MHITCSMNTEKLAIDFTGLTLWDIQDMDLDVYLYIVREAYIYKMSQTEQGREYLENCWRMQQTKPDRKKLREQFGPPKR